MKIKHIANDRSYRFTEDDIDTCWPYYKSYLIDILNGTYSLESAREDLASLVGSNYDIRQKTVG